MACCKRRKGRRQAQTGSRGVNQFHPTTSRTFGHPRPENGILTSSQRVVFSKHPATILLDIDELVKGGRAKWNNWNNVAIYIGFLQIWPCFCGIQLSLVKDPCNFHMESSDFFPWESAGAGLTELFPLIGSLTESLVFIMMSKHTYIFPYFSSRNKLHPQVSNEEPEFWKERVAVT